MSEFLTRKPRTHHNNALGIDNVGEKVSLYGWVQYRRDFGDLIFVDLRDREGLTQIVFDPEASKEAHALAERVRSEWCLGISGTVRKRGQQYSKKLDKMVDATNPNLATGAVEILVDELCVFSESETPPFQIEDNIDTAIEKRLEYRFLDLRRKELQDNFKIRHRIAQSTRRYFDENDFLEIETPMLVKYTPGGARNFVVPSRLNPNKFYALAESPQLFKQLFMMSGFERYFQIVKCFRDEDLRNDRQPEFTQIDLEMSFVTENDVQTMVEGLIKKIFKDTIGVELTLPLPRMTYDEAMARFGSDKPDLRFGMEHVNLTALINEHKGGGVPLFESTIVKDGGMCKAMRIPADKALSRAETDKLEGIVKNLGGRGLGRAKIGDDGAWTQSPFSKVISDELRDAITKACGGEKGDLLLFQFGNEKMVHTVMNGLRLNLGKRFGYMDEAKGDDAWKCLWITEFPVFEHDEKTDTYNAAHHPFTSPQIGHEDKLTTDPANCKARAYDLVINGNEVGGGSIRIHDTAVQSKVFDAMALSEEEKQQKFGFLLEALRYGTPPHGGLALGLDRLCMILSGADSLRNVIAFPKTQTGTCLLTGAPGPVNKGQLDDVYIAEIPKED